MYHVGSDDLTHARWKSRQLFALWFLSRLVQEKPAAHRVSFMQHVPVNKQKPSKKFFHPPECSINVNAPLLYEISTCTKTRQDDPKKKKKHCHIHTENEMQLDYIKGNKVLSIHPHITINLLIRQMTKFVCICPNYFLDFILLLQKDHFYILYVELCCWLQINVNTAYCRDNKLYKARYTCMYPCTLNAML